MQELSIYDISNEIGYSPKAIKNALKKLEKLGLIKVEKISKIRSKVTYIITVVSTKETLNV